MLFLWLLIVQVGPSIDWGFSFVAEGKSTILYNSIKYKLNQIYSCHKQVWATQLALLTKMS